LCGGIATVFLLVWVMIGLEHRSLGNGPAPPKAEVQPPVVPQGPTDTFVFYEALEQQNPDGSELMPLVPKKEEAAPLPSDVPPATQGDMVHPPRSGYTVQVAAFSSKPAAQALVDRLSRKGYPAYLHPQQIPGKGLWYRVRIGHYPKREEAEGLADRLQKKERLSGFVAIIK
jgi:cell division septation protein DedD